MNQYYTFQTKKATLWLLDMICYVPLSWFFKDKILSKFQIILNKQIKQNNITDQSLTGNSLKGSELNFKDKILSNSQTTIPKQDNKTSDEVGH